MAVSRVLNQMIRPPFSVIAKVQPEPARRTRAQGAAATGAQPSSPANKDRIATSSAELTAATDCRASTVATAARSTSTLSSRPTAAAAATSSIADSTAPASTADIAAADPDHQSEPPDNGGRLAKLQDRARRSTSDSSPTAAADGDSLSGHAASEARTDGASRVHPQLSHAAATRTAATASPRATGSRAASAAGGGDDEAENAQNPRLQVRSCNTRATSSPIELNRFHYRFCNYKTSKEKNLRIHLEALHPGVSNAEPVSVVAAAPVSNQVPTIAVASKVRLLRFRPHWEIVRPSHPDPLSLSLARFPHPRRERNRPLPLCERRLQQRLHARRHSRPRAHQCSPHDPDLNHRAAERAGVGAAPSAAGE